MSVEYSPHGAGPPPSTLFRSPERRTVASYEQELRRHRRTESGLREALAREETLLCQKDELIQHQAVLSQESDHRLLNGVQMIVSLLSLQGGRRRMLKLLRNWPQRPIALPRSGASTGVSTHWMAYKLLHSSNIPRTFVVTSP